LTGQGRWHTTSVQILDAQLATHLLMQGDRSKKITEKNITRSRGVGLASPLLLVAQFGVFLEAKLQYYKSVTF
jgi:hypothetical protein